jgi:hypothetical protein
MIRKTATIAAIVCMIASSPAYGQATRTWVSGVGDDVNPCSRTAPCKTFAGAFSKTAVGGEINAIDPGGFGAITINKSITIDGQGPMAGILALNQTGIIINGAGITVNLRNLTINGANGTIGSGIRIINAAAVNIDNVRIQNFAGSSNNNGSGIVIATAADVRVTVTNSDLYNNFFVGIHSIPTAGTVTLVVDNVRVSRGDFSSIQLQRNTNAFINRATLTNSRTAAGVTAEQSTVTANISNSLIANNAFGVFNGAGGSPVMRLYGNVITGNTTAGLNIVSGQVISLGNNQIRGNVGNEVPSSTITTQ